MKKKILVIDDDEDLLLILKMRLQEEGYDVKINGDPGRAEEFLEKYDPDLLILDVFMPGITGLEIMEDFKKRNIYQELPKIVLTGLDDNTERIVAKGWGATEYIVKPYDSEALLKKIQKLLKS